MFVFFFFFLLNFHWEDLGGEAHSSNNTKFGSGENNIGKGHENKNHFGQREKDRQCCHAKIIHLKLFIALELLDKKQYTQTHTPE